MNNHGRWPAIVHPVHGFHRRSTATFTTAHENMSYYKCSILTAGCKAYFQIYGFRLAPAASDRSPSPISQSRLMQGIKLWGDRTAGHGTADQRRYALIKACRRKAAIWQISAIARCCSWSGEWVSRSSKAAKILSLVWLRTAMMKGKPKRSL